MKTGSRLQRFWPQKFLLMRLGFVLQWKGQKISSLPEAGWSAAASVVIRFTWALGWSHFSQHELQSHVWNLLFLSRLSTPPALPPPSRFLLFGFLFFLFCFFSNFWKLNLSQQVETDMTSEKESNGLDNYAFAVSLMLCFCLITKNDISGNLGMNFFTY